MTKQYSHVSWTTKAFGYATPSGYVGYDPKTGKKMIFATEAEYLEWLEDDENTESEESENEKLLRRKCSTGIDCLRTNVRSD